MPLAEVRARLATQQAALVAALAGDGLPPAGFDAERLQAAAVALSAKRARSVARAWPALAKALGDRFHACFATYAASQALPPGGAACDGFAFARALARQGRLPDAGKMELLAVSLRQVVRPEGYTARRGVSWVTGVLQDSRRVVVGARFPLLGERWVSFGLGWLARNAGRRAHGKNKE